jgi:hypothetical protein
MCVFQVFVTWPHRTAWIEMHATFPTRIPMKPSTITEALKEGKPLPKRKNSLIGADLYSGMNGHLSSQLPLGLLAPSTYLGNIQTGKSKKKSWYQYIFSESRTRQ